MEWSKRALSKWANETDKSRGELIQILNDSSDEVGYHYRDYIDELIEEFIVEGDKQLKWGYACLVMNVNKDADDYFSENLIFREMKSHIQPASDVDLAYYEQFYKA